MTLRTLISVRTRNGTKRDEEDAINLGRSLMVNRRSTMVGTESR
jgi:hypothetical protein